MSRTRAGLLDGAVSVVERHGLRRLTMSAVATRSGVSKATLYNHFRTKDDVIAAVVLREVELMADDADAAVAQARATGSDLVAAAAAGLARAAGAAAEHVAARRVAAENPGALVPLWRSDGGLAWTLARGRLAAILGVPADDPLVRLAAGWVVSQVLDPEDPADQAVTAAALARAAAQSRRGLTDPAAALEAALTGPADS
jgi:AcrR family transcriptional regulator